ncbi:hypothetical protein GGU11DRAFT_803942 [Lentinula aff. detonsa]|nr:hypothetical protein GGU11DRAFT_803942 [Lentinula aff. detonsa]
MNNDSERDEEPKAPKEKKRKGNDTQSNTVSCYHCRKSKVHCSWNDKVKSNPIVGDALQPTEFYERIAVAMEGIQDSMVGIAYELRQFHLQVGSWQDTILADRSRWARIGEALEALEIERELQEAELGEEEDKEEEEEEEEEEKKKTMRRSAPI